MKVEQAKEIASRAIEQLSQALEKGHSEVLSNYLSAIAKFHRYSLHNVMLIASQRPDATRVAGYQTWKKLGRFVKKGAKGILILAPVFLKRTTEDISQEESARVPAGFRAAYVFDISDTDGEPLPKLATTQGDPAGNTERLKKFVAACGLKLEYSDEIYPALGEYSPGKIALLPGQSPAQEFCTLAHEVAHSILHKHGRRVDIPKPVRETEAEAVAYVVCEAIGLKAQGSADYIHLYTGDKDTLAESLERVLSASTKILTAITPSN